jgi:hypothetical protein
MSFMLTTEQIANRSKTVTRRMGWEFLKAGDMVQAVVKCQGLKKGEKIKPLCVLRVKSVRRERLDCLTRYKPPYGKRECEREGFPDMKPHEFLRFFCKSHKGSWRKSVVTRIEFEYVD